MQQKGWLSALALVLLSAVLGCGYGFSSRGEGFPKDVRTVFIEPFVNRSRIVGIEAELASALKSEFHRRGELRVVDRLDQADAILSGVVRSVDDRVIAVNKEDEALQFEVSLVADVSLRRRSPDEILWRTQGAKSSEIYSGSRGAVVTTSSEFKSGTLNASDLPRFTDIQLTESLKQEAREEITGKFARDLHQRLMDLF